MPRLLENLEHGTPVITVPDGKVAEVRGVFAIGETRVPGSLLIYWHDTGEETLLDADEVLNITDEGVVLRSARKLYEVLPAFDPARDTQLHRLA